jgi:glycosyltransferase involved in cell wall biosynthesis
VRVLHLISSASYGGAEAQILELSCGQVRAGQQVGLLVLHRSRGGRTVHPLVSRAQAWGITVTQFEDWARFPLWLVPRIARQLREGGFDLLHTHGYKADLLGRFAARMARVPIVATIHGYTDAFLSVRVYKHLDLLALHRFPKVIAVSNYLRQRLIASGLAPNRVVTVHNAINTDVFVSAVGIDRGEIRAELGIRPDVPVILTVGRLNPEKGHRYLLESAQLVWRHIPNLRVLIAGEGPLREQLEASVHSLHLDAVVSFLGWRDDVASLMAISDLFVLPSTRESFGLVILEALAMGMPVIATRVGGVPEIVWTGETGILVKPRDAEALAKAMTWALTNPAQAGQLARQGQAVVRQRFSVQAMVKATNRIYHEVRLSARF